MSGKWKPLTMRHIHAKSLHKKRAEWFFCHYVARFGAKNPSETSLGWKNRWDGTAVPWDGSAETGLGSAGRPHGGAENSLERARAWPSALTVCHMAHKGRRAREKARGTDAAAGEDVHKWAQNVAFRRKMRTFATGSPAGGPRRTDAHSYFKTRHAI